VEPVGEFDQNHPQIPHHGQQHLADAFCLPLLTRSQVELAQLGDSVDALRHLVSEALAHVLQLGAGVLHYVVQQPGLKAHHVHVHIGKLASHQQRMNHVRLSGFALLIPVPLLGEAEGAVERSKVLFGTKLQDAVPQLAVERFDRIGDGPFRNRQDRGGVHRIARHSLTSSVSDLENNNAVPVCRERRRVQANAG